MGGYGLTELGREPANGLKDIQQYQLLSKYSKWNGSRRETFDESVLRSLEWLTKSVNDATGYNLSLSEYAELREAMYGMSAFPSLRLFQMAGPALDRCNVGLYNC